ncbi:MAG TPA: radical SAM family heme chaperone HemW [Gammaproteobacteria bacterium]|nr:radical SAM family heme chaperone HemW [Gammaproteobacteria bacterium]
MTALLTFRDSIPLSLYVHLPWCVRKCPYCDFNSHETGDLQKRETAYVNALVRDLESALPVIWGRPVNTIFIGGGTPSLFSPESLNRLLQALQARLNFYPGIEITMEANPGTAEAGKFRNFRQAGINRLSIGVQSFNNEHLHKLGRIHDAAEAQDAVQMAKDAGFEDINIDIMYGLPGQSREQALGDLQQAVELEPAHVSWYQLTIEPNTVFYARPPRLPDDERIWEMQQSGQQLLAQQGYRQYEISAYARDGYQCLHNLNYWQFGDYLGIGAGAHSKLTDVSAGKVIREARHRMPERYMELAGSGAAIAERKQLDRDDLQLEFMMNCLRLTGGVHPSLFMQRTGLPLSEAGLHLQQAESRGLVEWDIERLKPTEKGLQYLNDLLQYFMPENEQQSDSRRSGIP